MEIKEATMFSTYRDSLVAAGERLAPGVPLDWTQIIIVGDAQRELGEVVNYAISAYKKGLDVEQIFAANPTESTGYLARYIIKALEHYVAYPLPSK